MVSTCASQLITATVSSWARASGDVMLVISGVSVCEHSCASSAQEQGQRPLQTRACK